MTELETQVALVGQRIDTVEKSHEALAKRLNGNLERFSGAVESLREQTSGEIKELRQLISDRFGPALNDRIDERIKVDKAEHPAPVPGWVPWIIGGLSTVATGCVVWIVTR